MGASLVARRRAYRRVIAQNPGRQRPSTAHVRRRTRCRRFSIRHIRLYALYVLSVVPRTSRNTSLVRAAELVATCIYYKKSVPVHVFLHIDVRTGYIHIGGTVAVSL
jgi:hypothetical protein